MVPRAGSYASPSICCFRDAVQLHSRQTACAAMKVLREPLLHFLLLASLLFALDHLFSTAKKHRIVVDQQTVSFLISEREQLMMRELDSAEREQLIAAYVEDEMLYREAYRRGLDRADSRMRKNLILKMRGLLSSDIEEPSQPQLRSYYETHRQGYVRPASISVDHVYFPEQTPPPPRLLEQLRAGTDYKMVGDSRLGQVMPDLTADMLAARFGADGARRMLAIDDSQWHGPFESSQGLHYVRVYERSVEHPMSYQEMQPFLRSEWRVAQARQAVAQGLERIQRDYNVLIAEGVAGPDSNQNASDDGTAR